MITKMPGGPVTNVPALDANGALVVGGDSSTTALTLGSASVAALLAGGATIPTGKAITGAGAMAFEAAGALSIGVNASTTSITIGQATVAALFAGGITVAANKLIQGGAGTLGLDTTGALSVGPTTATSLSLGRAAITTTVLGALAMGGAAHVSALATFISTTQGLLVPVMTATQRDAIGTPAEGLVLYDVTGHKLNVRAAAAWEVVTSVGV